MYDILFDKRRDGVVKIYARIISRRFIWIQFYVNLCKNQLAKYIRFLFIPMFVDHGLF